MKKTILGLLLALTSFYSSALCPGGQVEVTITISTDAYGNEGYWQLVPSGNACGTGTIFAGGNPLVGCNGAGNQGSPNGGYPNNTTLTEGPWCLTQGSDFDIIFNDDWLDGGLTFTININGYPIHAGLTGSGNGTTFTFTAEPPPASDVACRSIKMLSYLPLGSINPEAWISNLGSDTIHSFDLYYSFNNSTPQLNSYTGVNINPFDSILVTANVAYNLNTIGAQDLLMYANLPNGVTDMNSLNDSAHKTFTCGPAIPNIIDDYVTSPVTYTIIGDASNSIAFPTDLDFHPVLSRYELWVTLRGTESSGGSTVKFMNAGLPGQTSLLQTDGNAWHFMSLPSALAFSENENFATSPSVYDSNHDGGNPFTGPGLWSSDPSVYAITPPGGNGSHLDMLHQSPRSMGICSEAGNKFWVFDNNDHELVSYDFKEDHGPGNSDHSDGVVRRYSGLGLAGDPNFVIGSHLVIDKTEGVLYINDTYNDRILRMDIHSGTFVSNLVPYEPTAEYSTWSNVTWNVLVGTGIDKPSGIDILGDRLIVSEYNSGDIVIYDLNGSSATEIGRLQTGAPGVMGVKIGPDGKIWYVNSLTNKVVRIDPSNVGINELSTTNFVLYPNPANDKLNILLNEQWSDARITINDLKGSLISSQSISAGEKNMTIDISDLTTGVYTLSIRSDENVAVKRFVKN